MTKAMPLASGTCSKNSSRASSPPADAPMPTMGNPFGVLGSGGSDGMGTADPFFRIFRPDGFFIVGIPLRQAAACVPIFVGLLSFRYRPDRIPTSFRGVYKCGKCHIRFAISYHIFHSAKTASCHLRFSCESRGYGGYGDALSISTIAFKLRLNVENVPSFFSPSDSFTTVSAPCLRLPRTSPAHSPEFVSAPTGQEHAAPANPAALWRPSDGRARRAPAGAPRPPRRSPR